MSKPLQTLSSGHTVFFLLFFSRAKIEKALPSSLNSLFICTVIDIFRLFIVPPMNDELFHRFVENEKNFEGI